MQAPRTRRSRVTLEFDIDRQANIVNVRPIRRAGDNVNIDRILTDVAVELQKRVIDHVKSITGFTKRRIKSNVTGVLQMSDMNDVNKAQTEGINVGEIDLQTFLEIFDRGLGNGSDPYYTLHDVQWSFWINPATIRVGRGKEFDGSKYKGLQGWKFKLPEKYNHVGCAAQALAFCRIRKEKERKYILISKNMYPNQVGKEAESIQNELGWNEDVTIQDFYQYVVKYPEYRIVIIQSVFLKAYDYRGARYEQNEDRKKDKTYYVYYDMESEHFTYCSSPQEFIISVKKNCDIKWCYKCATFIDSKTKNSECNCGKIVSSYKPKKRAVCDHCGTDYAVTHKKNHKCFATLCHYCKQYYGNEYAPEHRCPLYIKHDNFMKRFIGEVAEDADKEYKLWVWDIESQMVPIEDTETDEYPYDENGQFVLRDGVLETYTVTKCVQVPNFVAWQNVFNPSEKFTTYNFQEFVEFTLTHNNGKNVFLAHNSSGYDTRLLFEEINKVTPPSEQPEPIFKGTKFMRLVMNGRTIFQDSMLHLSGSLSSLASAFGLNQTKGYFPHLFNKAENLDYSGPIPPKDTFDLSFIAKSKGDLEKFDEWYKDQEFVVWNFKEELEKYCILDVSLLAQIVRIYHDKLTESLSEFPHITISPWFFPTMAGYVHKIMLRHLHEGEEIESLSLEHPREFQEYVQNTWAVLEPEEHYYAKQALRGGRTDIRQYYYKGDINYKDIQSHYPHVQLKYDYPTGTPVIEVHDQDYYPCNVCWANPTEICRHTYENKKEWIAKVRNKLVIKEIQYDGYWPCTNTVCEPIHQYINDFFGILTVDVTPNPKLYHPVLIVFDEKKKKCIATLEPIVKGTFTSVELQRAMEMGYTVTKIYRADRYRKNPSIWKSRGLLGALYLNKMKNSGFAPQCHEERRRMRITFASKFGIDLGNMDAWAPNKVLKKVAKGPVTAAWGKHAESVDHANCKIFGVDDFSNGSEFYESINRNQMRVNQFSRIGNNRIMFKYTESRRTQKPDLHKGYLPAAVFVTSYARLYLWEELNKLGKRVLMHDTDSIVYAAQEGEYDIEEGDCLGDWETEDDQINNDGICEFVAIGPKSYGLKFGNGKTTVKCKGVSLKYSHELLFNFEVMKDLLFNYTNVKLPQLSFDYLMNHGISTRKFLKTVRFNKYDVKGNYNPEDYRNYPYGYIE